MRDIGHFVGGKEVKGGSGRTGDVFNPNTGEVQAKVAFASKSEVEQAIANAAAAQPAWAATNPQRRARVMFKFLELVQAEYDDLARLLSSEHGKTFVDAKGDIQRGLEVVEFACGIPHLMKGEFSDNAGPGIDLYSLRQPLGVVAGITPFNFPAMIPLWKCAPAIACGNAFILKPSERDPSVPMRIAELFLKAGLPAGILNVVNGDKEAVDTLLTDPRVQAIGFVGSSAIAEYIYATGCAHGKARAVLRRRQEPHDRDAGRRHGSGGRCAGRRRLRLGRRALHGDFGRGAGRPEDRRRADEEARSARREPEDRPLDRPERRLRPDGDPRALQQGEGLRRHRRQGRRQARGRWPQLQAPGLRERQLHGRLPVRRGDARHAHLQGGDFRPGPLGGARQGLRGGAAAAVGERIRQRRLDLHPRRRHRTRLHEPRPGRYGRGELRDSRAAVVLHIRRMEAFRLRRSQSARAGFDPLLHQDQDGDRALAVRHQGRRRVRHSDDEVSRKRMHDLRPAFRASALILVLLALTGCSGIDWPGSSSRRTATTRTAKPGRHRSVWPGAGSSVRRAAASAT